MRPGVPTDPWRYLSCEAKPLPPFTHTENICFVAFSQAESYHDIGTSKPHCWSRIQLHPIGDGQKGCWLSIHPFQGNRDSWKLLDFKPCWNSFHSRNLEFGIKSDPATEEGFWWSLGNRNIRRRKKCFFCTYFRENSRCILSDFFCLVFHCGKTDDWPMMYKQCFNCFLYKSLKIKDFEISDGGFVVNQHSIRVKTIFFYCSTS